MTCFHINLDDFYIQLLLWISLKSISRFENKWHKEINSWIIIIHSLFLQQQQQNMMNKIIPAIPPPKNIPSSLLLLLLLVLPEGDTLLDCSCPWLNSAHCTFGSHEAIPSSEFEGGCGIQHSFWRGSGDPVSGHLL